MFRRTRTAFAVHHDHQRAVAPRGGDQGRRVAQALQGNASLLHAGDCRAAFSPPIGRQCFTQIPVSAGFASRGASPQRSGSSVTESRGSGRGPDGEVLPGEPTIFLLRNAAARRMARGKDEEDDGNRRARPALPGLRKAVRRFRAHSHARAPEPLHKAGGAGGQVRLQARLEEAGLLRGPAGDGFRSVKSRFHRPVGL